MSFALVVKLILLGTAVIIFIFRYMSLEIYRAKGTSPLRPKLFTPYSQEEVLSTTNRRKSEVMRFSNWLYYAMCGLIALLLVILFAAAK